MLQIRQKRIEGKNAGLGLLPCQFGLMAIFFVMSWSGCKTPNSDSISDTENSDVSAETERLDHSEESFSEEEAQIEEGALEEGFCKDDVYASYLRERFMQANQSQLKSVGSSNARKSLERKLELDALFHARSRLVGPMTEYFGALPVTANPRVEYWMKYFKTNGRQQFLKWLVRGESVRQLVGPLLRQEGLPQEIFFLGMIESGFSNTAYSKARATGPWQFMKATAQLYGLKLSHWVDERRDPVKSTIAAARYLKDMYVKFGDWYLAMASYNAGPGKISRAIRKSGSRDFWRISQTSYIRAETKHYVPKVLAATILASNPQLNGFDIKPDPLDETPTTYVNLARPVKIDELALKLNVPAKMISQWNPELLRNITPPTNQAKGETYQLRLPNELVQKFNEVQDELAFLDIKDVTLHKIKSGDNLTSIARKYGVGVDQIKRLNPELRIMALRIGNQIAVPVPSIGAH